jgi:hypothetical protein
MVYPVNKSMVLSSSQSRLSKTSQRSLLRSRDLDFWILTGCSCLITLLHHPLVNHLQGGPGTSNANRPSSTAGQSSPTSTSAHSLSNYSAIAPKRQSFTIEDEEV